ncbi:hypothetical protein DFJ74DRAFT_690247 [Hyaloraphidium curvatum]|nr:hypothetical protein DFJ74DRAFT_690247 [Hyaloraphidium curvatum]
MAEGAAGLEPRAPWSAAVASSLGAAGSRDVVRDQPSPASSVRAEISPMHGTCGAETEQPQKYGRPSASRSLLASRFCRVRRCGSDCGASAVPGPGHWLAKAVTLVSRRPRHRVSHGNAAERSFREPKGPASVRAVGIRFSGEAGASGWRSEGGRLVPSPPARTKACERIPARGKTMAGRIDRDRAFGASGAADPWGRMGPGPGAGGTECGRVFSDGARARRARKQRSSSIAFGQVGLRVLWAPQHRVVRRCPGGVHGMHGRFLAFPTRPIGHAFPVRETFCAWGPGGLEGGEGSSGTDGRATRSPPGQRARRAPAEPFGSWDVAQTRDLRLPAA